MVDRDLFTLEGKVALVTGGAGILGSEVCDGLAAYGARVAVLDIDGAAAELTAGNIQTRHGTRCLGVGCDVGNPTSVTSAIEKVVEEFGTIHVLHNNAATKGRDLKSFFQPFEEFSIDTWRDVMRVDLDGMFLVAQAVGRHMVARGKGGSIIQTGSIYGVVAPDQRIYEGSEHLNLPINTPAVYSAAKAAVIGLSRYLATYWAPHGIRVNTIVPGGIESGQNENFQRQYSSRTPLGRMARRDEMVGAIIYLASDASSYVTGHTLIVDGGWSAW